MSRSDDYTDDYTDEMHHIKPSLITRELSGSSRRKERIRWDEVTISQHDKERGHRMPINEPQTPYHSSLSCDSDNSSCNGRRGITVDELNEQLLKLSDLESSLTSESELEGSHNNDDNDGKSKKFATQRKAHYNEYHVLKELRSTGSLSDLE